MSWGCLEPEPQLPQPPGEPSFGLAVRWAGGSWGNPHTSMVLLNPQGPAVLHGTSLALLHSPLHPVGNSSSKKGGKHPSPSMLSTSSASSSCWHGVLGAACPLLPCLGGPAGIHCSQPCCEPLKVLVIPGASALFPWGELKTSAVHIVPVAVPSVLSLPGAVGAHLARVWQKRQRPKPKFVLCIQDPAYTEGLGRRWLCLPHSRGCSDPSAPHHPSKLQTCTHTHTHGKGVPRGLGGKRRRRKCLSPQNHVSTEPRKVHYCPAAAGSTEVQSAPRPVPRCSPPGRAPSVLGALPAAVYLLKPKFYSL